MLKAIKKFVLDHRRNANPEKRQVIEEDHPSEVGSVSQAPAEVAEPRQDEPAAALPVLGKVKWYDPNKRYGFVELSDGSGDAFLDATALAGIGTPALRSGDTVELRITLQERGPQVTEVISVVSSIPDALRRPQRSFRSLSIRKTLAAGVQELGTVKWYNATKGFGFVVLDGGGKEIFLHSSVLKRAGIAGLHEGQRVFIGVAEGRKGPEAASIQLA